MLSSHGVVALPFWIIGLPLAVSMISYVRSARQDGFIPTDRVIGSIVAMLNKGAKGDLAETAREEAELYRSLTAGGNIAVRSGVTA